MWWHHVEGIPVHAASPTDCMSAGTSWHSLSRTVPEKAAPGNFRLSGTHVPATIGPKVRTTEDGGNHREDDRAMKIKYGLISCDSHAQLHKDTWTSRMSSAKFGDKIPELRETTDKAHMAVAFDKPVQRWFVYDKVVGERGVVNCPTVMNDPLRKTFP
jgi:hypothetical protein